MLLTAAAPQGDARRRALAAWSATGAAAGASGLVLGGVLTDLAGWRLLFWANVPLAVLLLLAVGRTAAVAAVVTGTALLEGAAHRGAAVGLLLAGAAAAAVLPAVERRAGDPLVTPAAGRDPHLRSGALASFANTATTSSAVTLATLHLQQVQGHSASAAGLALVPFSLCVVVGAALAAHLLRRLPTRTAASVGLTVIAAGNAALLADSLGPWVLPAAVGVSGVGIGVSSVAATSLGTDVAPTLQGTAGGVLNTAAQLGTALGVAAVLLVAPRQNSSPSHSRGRRWAGCSPPPRPQQPQSCSGRWHLAWHPLTTCPGSRTRYGDVLRGRGGWPRRLAGDRPAGQRRSESALQHRGRWADVTCWTRRTPRSSEAQTAWSWSSA